MKISFTPPKTTFYGLLFILAGMLVYSCTKMDRLQQPTAAQMEERFFTAKANTPAPVLKVMAALKKQNTIGGFIPMLAAKDGYALWEHSTIEKPGSIPAYNRNGETFQPNTTLVFTPIVQQDSNFVNGFFFSKIVGDSVELHLYRANDYDLYPYGTADSSVVTAERITLEILYFNNQIFGKRKYEISDQSLFFSVHNVRSNFKRSTIEATADTTVAGRLAFFVICTETKNCWCFRPGKTCGADHPCMLGFCDMCYWCIDVDCNTTAVPGGGDPGGSWPPDPPPPSSGGGGNPPAGGGNCSGVNNCAVLRSLIVQGRVPCGGCGSGPVVVVPPDEPYNPNEAANIIIDTSISNNYPCLSILLTNMPNINRETQKFMNNAFGLQKNVHLVFAMKASLDTLTDAETASPVLINNPNSSIFKDTIYLNPHSIKNATKEYTVATILHESFHAYYNYLYTLYTLNMIDSNRIKTETPLFWELGVSPNATQPWISQHEEMAYTYLGAIESTVKYYYNPLAPDSVRNRVSRNIAWGGLEESTIWALPGRDSCRIWADINAARNTYYTPTLNTGGCPNYSYSHHTLSLSEPCD